MSQSEPIATNKFDKSDLLRFPPNLVLDGKPVEFYIRPRSVGDRRTVRQALVQREYEMRSFTRYERVIRLYDSLIAEGKTPLIIDAGANIGASVIYWRHIFPEAKIIAIEPIESNCSILRINCENVSNYELFEGALSNTKTPLFLSDTGNGELGLRIGTEGDIKVPTTTIPLLLAQQDDSVVPFIVKIDIEGGEERLFSTATKWVADIPCIITELSDWMFGGEATSKNFFKIVSKGNFDMILAGEHVVALNNDVLPEVDKAASSIEPAQLVSVSQLYYEFGDYKECIEAARKAITLRPEYALAYNNICAANNKLGNFKEAIEAGEHAVRLQPDNQLAKNNLKWAIDQLNKK